MSRGATLSIMGLYNNDPTVLDMMVFPEGFTDEQKTIAKENILVECSEFEFLYPAPEVAKTIIGIWSRKEKPYWDRVYAASKAEYNPIENYRRNETETVEDGRTEEHSGNDVSRASGTDTDARTGTETRDHDAEHVTTLDETNVDTLSGNDQLKRTGTETTDHDAEHVTTLDETNVDTLSGDDTIKRTGTDTNSGSSSSTDTNSGTDTINNSVTGYDSNTLVAHDSSDTIHGHVVTNAAQGSNTIQHNTQDKTEYGKIDTTDHDAETTETHDDTDTLTLNTVDKTEYGKVDTTDHDAETTETHDDTDTLTLNTLETFVHGKTDTLTHGEKIEHEGSSERTMLAYGNIGVTTSQEMLTQELELAKIIEVVPIIIESFKNRFCLMIY